MLEWKNEIKTNLAYFIYAPGWIMLSAYQFLNQQVYSTMFKSSPRHHSYKKSTTHQCIHQYIDLFGMYSSWKITVMPILSYVFSRKALLPGCQGVLCYTKFTTSSAARIEVEITDLPARDSHPHHDESKMKWQNLGGWIMNFTLVSSSSSLTI